MKIFNYLILGLFFVIVTSCDKKEDEPVVTIQDIVGSWKATSSVFTNNADPGEEVDLIAIGGELRFTMLDGGGVRTWLELDTISDEWDSQAVITNNIMTLTPVEMDRGINTFEFELNNNILELYNSSTSFDFTLSGADEVPASSVTIFERN